MEKIITITDTIQVCNSFVIVTGTNVQSLGMRAKGINDVRTKYKVG